jgi:hypothetical protein
LKIEKAKKRKRRKKKRRKEEKKKNGGQIAGRVHRDLGVLGVHATAVRSAACIGTGGC